MTRISAGELRAIGLPIPDDVPDCAWIPRSAMLIEVTEVTAENGILTTHLVTRFSEPFKWVSVTGEVKE
jgi:hypothetical protein